MWEFIKSFQCEFWKVIQMMLMVSISVFPIITFIVAGIISYINSGYECYDDSQEKTSLTTVHIIVIICMIINIIIIGYVDPKVIMSYEYISSGIRRPSMWILVVLLTINTGINIEQANNCGESQFVGINSMTVVLNILILGSLFNLNKTMVAIKLHFIENEMRKYWWKSMMWTQVSYQLGMAFYDIGTSKGFVTDDKLGNLYTSAAVSLSVTLRTKLAEFFYLKLVKPNSLIIGAVEELHDRATTPVASSKTPLMTPPELENV